jgi:serine/threonine-protein kinase
VSTSEPVDFGRYRLLCLLGQGAMARVYKAQLAGPMSFKKTVALKRIDRSVTADDKIVRALINEALLGGTLRHKNVVEIYEFGDVGGEYFMAMEYVEGWTLDTILGNCRTEGRWMPRSVAVAVLEQLLRGLAYAHDLTDEEGRRLNLIHRDLKPANIMVSAQGDVKIMDFGIAKADSNLYKTTAGDVVKGTPVYMSPEQVKNERLDLRSDLFAIGSVLHEMITLQVPFQGDNLIQIITGIMSGDVAEPLARVARRFPELESFTARLLAGRREDRFPDAHAALSELEELRHGLENEPTLAEWLRSIRPTLPLGREHGDFGPDGPPTPLTLAGQEVPEARADAERDGRRRTQDAVAPVGAPTSAPVAPKKKRRKSVSGAAGWVVAAAMTVGSVAMWWTARPPGDPARSPGPAEGPDAGRPGPRDEAVRAPGEAATPEGTPPEGAASAGAAGIGPEPTRAGNEGSPRRTGNSPASSSEGGAPRKQAAAGSTEAAGAPASPPVVVSTPTPDPTAPPLPPDAAPEPAPVGSGTVDINSMPWSTISIDGKVVGIVPLHNHELPAGTHTVTFECGGCPAPASRTVEITLRPGEKTNKFITF